MYRISVLVLCLLSATAFADEENISDTTLSSSLPTTDYSEIDNFVTCENDKDCEGPPGVYSCSNGTCYECYDCCTTKEELCPARKCFCSWFLTDDELKIVAQAVLGVAVFVTCVALLSLLWKVCARRVRQRHASAAAGVDLLDDTVSLNSQQVFVVERLRDRPPRYEEAARDFAVEKPPPYSEVVVEEGERTVQTVSVGGVTVTLVAGGLTARDFAAPPPYSPPAPPVPPPAPATPPVQRLRRCVRKVVLIGRLGRRATEVDGGSRPKIATTRQLEAFRILSGPSGAAGGDSELTPVVRSGSRPEATPALPVVVGAASEETTPGSPSSSAA